MSIIADTLTRIKNASILNNNFDEVRKSRTVLSMLKILQEEKFIKSFEDADGVINVALLYDGKNPVFTDAQLVSKPSKRVYVSKLKLKPVFSGRGIGIISTSKGFMTVDKAKSEGLGGEYICKIW